MLFNANVTVVSVDIEPNEDEQSLSTNLVLGLGLPQQNNTLAMVPAGVLNFQLDKQSANKIGDRFKEVAEGLQDKPNIEVASNMSDVEGAANAIQQFQGGSNE